MKGFLGGLIVRFSSRKFLVCVAGLVGVTAFPELAQPIVAICGIYAGAEGAADVVQRYKEGSQTVLQAKQVVKAVEDGTLTPTDGAAVPGNVYFGNRQQ